MGCTNGQVDEAVAPRNLGRPRPRVLALEVSARSHPQVGAGFKPALAQQTSAVRLRIAYRGIDLDAFIVMPNHVHGIVILVDEPETRCGIPEIVRGFKTFSARRVNERAGRRGAVWQRGYYEHVIRNEKALDRIRDYIANNPARWADDPDNLSRPAYAERRRV